MEHGQHHLPDRAIQPFEERLEAIRDFLSLTSRKLFEQTLFHRHAQLLEKPEQSEFYGKKLSDVINMNVEAAAAALIALKNDTADNLRIVNPDDGVTYGKLCGLTYSKEKLAYVGEVLMPNAARIDWPIIDASQLFIGTTPPKLPRFHDITNPAGDQVQLHPAPNSVLLNMYGTNSWRF
ncbi:MAG TPA: hypothetical protein VFL85_00500 [Candidatus Saccharimonadales bacterium]|nr:hypothetical protein [Candidatus Saccharimonadales bacterium]